MMLARLREHFGHGRLGRHLGFQLSQQLIETGCRTVTLLVIMRQFGPVNFAVLNLFTTSTMFFQKVVDGLASSLVKSVAEMAGRDRAKAFGIGWWGAGVATAVVASMGLAGVAGFAALRPEYAREHWLLIALTYIYGVLQFARQFVEAALRGLKRFSATFPAVAGVAVAQAAVSLVSAYYGMGVAEYLGLLAYFTGFQLVLLALACVRESRLDGVTFARGPELRGPLKELVRYSRPLVLRGMISFFYMKVNIYVVDGYTNKFEAGQYAAADRFLMIPQLVIGAFLATLAPRIAEKVSSGDREGLSYLMSRAYGAMLTLVAPFVILFLLAEYPIRWFFPAYLPAAALLRIFAASIIVTGFSTLCSGGLLVFGGRANVTTVVAAFGAILNVTTAYFFVRWWGAYGSALSILVVSWVVGLTEICLAHYFFKLPFRIRFR